MHVINKLTVLFLVVAAIIYSEPENGHLFYGLFLPLMGLLAAWYLLRLTGSLILFTGASAFHFMELEGTGWFPSLICPVILLLSIVAFLIWSWKEGYLTGGLSIGDSGAGSGGFSGGDCGGDGGGC